MQNKCHLAPTYVAMAWFSACTHSIKRTKPSYAQARGLVYLAGLV